MKLILRNLNRNKFSNYLNKIINLNYATNSNETLRVYAFGLNEHGALGFNDTRSNKKQKFTQRPIRHKFAEDNCVKDVACGFGFTIFSVDSADKLKIYGCGINTDKQISNENIEIITSPCPINIGIENSDTNVLSISAGRAHLGVVTDNEGIFLLGSNCYGQCGREIDINESSQPCFHVNHIEDLNGDKCVNIYCGQDHTLFLTATGDVYSCGWSADGQTGQITTENIATPLKVNGDICGEKIIKLAGRSDTVLALNENGDVFGWGSSEYLQLSPSKDMQVVNKPIHLKHLSKYGKVKDITAGGTSCALVTEDGDIYVWGYGILGGGPDAQKTNLPILLPRTLFGCNESSPDVVVEKVTSGLTYMMAINSCSHLYAWGNNKFGCLGIGHRRDQYFPFKVSLSGQALKASCGVDHTMIICAPF